MIRTVRLVTRPARYLASLVLPHQCMLCRCFADSTGLCAACWSGLAPIGAPVCEHCGLPLGHTGRTRMRRLLDGPAAAGNDPGLPPL